MPLRMTIRGKLAAALGLLAALTIAACVMVVLEFREFGDAAIALMRTVIPAMHEDIHLAAQASMIAERAQAMASAPSGRAVESIHDHMRDIVETLHDASPPQTAREESLSRAIASVPPLLPLLRDERLAILTLDATIGETLARARRLADTASNTVTLPAADTWRAVALLHEAALATDLETVERLATRFQRLHNSLEAAVPASTPPSDTQNAALHSLLRTGMQRENLFHLCTLRIEHRRNTDRILSQLGALAETISVNALATARAELHRTQDTVLRMHPLIDLGPAFAAATAAIGMLAALLIQRLIVVRTVTDRLRALHEVVVHPTRVHDDLGRLADGHDEISTLAAALRTAQSAAREDAAHRQDAEDSLHTCRERLDHISRMLELGVIIVDNATVITQANEAVGKILNVRPEVLLGKAFTEFVPERLHTELRRNVILRELGQTSRYEIDLARPDGSDVRCAISAAPLMDQSGRKTGTIALLDDLTEKRRMLRQHQQCELHRHVLFDNAPHGMLHLATDGRVIDCNARFATLTDIDRAACIGISLTDDGPNEELRIAATRAIHGRKSVHEGPCSFLPGQTPRALRITFTPLLPGASPTEAFAVAEDVSESRRLERSLAEACEAADIAARAKAQFLDNMNHEIRTPLNAILGLTHLATRQAPNPRIRSYLDQIGAAGQSLLGLVNRLLDISDIEAGRLAMDNQPFNLEDVMDAVNAFAAPMARDKSLELLVRIAPDTPTTLVGDAARLEMVLTSLADNAIKFTPQGHVVIAVGPESAQDERVTLHFSVSDTGIGFPPELAHGPFAPFSPGDASSTRRHGGSGIGLALSNRLVELMGGELRIEASETGTVVSFCATFERHHRTLRRPDRIPRSLVGLRALVVDDNPASREILRELVESLGMRATEATDGTDALNLLRSAPPDSPFALTLMDWGMPGMSGLDAARELLGPDWPRPRPRIIMVTAHAREKIRAAAKGIGIDAILIKPVSAHALIRTITILFTDDANTAAGTQTAPPDGGNRNTENTP